MQRIKKSKDHAPGFQRLLYYKLYSYFTLQKNLITFKIFTTYDINLCKILIKSKSLFLECISKKLSNLLMRIGIVRSQVHI